LNEEESEMKELLKRIWKDEDGQRMVEYGLIIAGIAIAIIIVLFALGDDIKNLFSSTSNKMNERINAT